MIYILYYAHTMQPHDTTPCSPQNNRQCPVPAYPSCACRAGIVSKQFDRVRWFVDTTRAADASFHATLFLFKDSTLWEIAPKKLISDFHDFSREPWPILDENLLRTFFMKLEHPSK